MSTATTLTKLCSRERKSKKERKINAVSAIPEGAVRGYMEGACETANLTWATRFTTATRFKR